MIANKTLTTLKKAFSDILSEDIERFLSKFSQLNPIQQMFLWSQLVTLPENSKNKRTRAKGVNDENFIDKLNELCEDISDEDYLELSVLIDSLLAIQDYPSLSLAPNKLEAMYFDLELEARKSLFCFRSPLKPSPEAVWDCRNELRATGKECA